MYTMPVIKFCDKYNKFSNSMAMLEYKKRITYDKIVCNAPSNY